MTNVFRGAIAGATIFVWAVAWTLEALPTQPVAPAVSRPAEPPPENVQVLEGVSRDQLMAAMEFMRASLGVECDHCHEPGAFARDTKEPKRTAREMIRMTRAINASNFGGERQVTCYSCHRGSRRPVATPAITGEPPAQRTGSADATPTTALPSARDVLARYVVALGGENALRNLSTRREEGTITAGARKFPLEVLAKAPDQRIATMRLPNGDSVAGYDGRTGWTALPGEPTREISGPELASARLEARFFPALELEERFEDLRVTRSDVDGQKAHTVLALQDGQVVVEAAFDSASGLLLRLMRYDESPLGRLPTRIDFAEYRAVDGVQVPFRRTVSRPRRSFRIELERVEHNVPVDDAAFAIPVPVP